MHKRLFNLLIISALLFAVGCGYYNPYVLDSNADPITLHRSMWKNQTNQLGLETVFYQKQSNWFRRTKLIILQEKEVDSQYSLAGTIESIDYKEISYGGNSVATELRARLTVSYTLVDNTTEKTIWQNRATYTETYKQDSNQSQLEFNKNEALEEIADDVSEEIYLYIINKVLRKQQKS